MERLQYVAQLMHYAAGHLRAPDPTPNPAPTSIDVNATVHHAVTNIGWVLAAALAALVGVSIMSRATRGSSAQAATSGGIYVFGAVFLAGAFVMFALASGLVNLLFGA